MKLGAARIHTAFSVFRLEFIISSMAFRSLAAAGAVVSAAAYVLWHQRKRWVRIPGQGLLIGAAEDGVIRFLGVPFASIVDKRWQPPGRPESWVFPRRNPTKLWRCPQPCIGWNAAGGKIVLKNHELHEDEAKCLNLNVWTPSAAGKSRPIIVYIHGGAGKLLSPHDDDFNGEHLARRHGMVYVSLSYRLGALGFLAHPALSAEDAAAAAAGTGEVAGSGNYAMLDLLAGLRWVQAHGARFGGDVGNVTIWGLSTGAQLVATLLVCPLAAGLFHRAMIQSCVDLTNVRELHGKHEVWQHKTAEEWGRSLAKVLGCERADTTEELEAIRRVEVSRLIEKSWDPAATDMYEPCVDRRDGLRVVKPLTSLEALTHGKFHRVPVMIGVTEHDGLGRMELEWTMLEECSTPAQYRALLARKFGAARVEAALAQYPASSPQEVDAALGAISNDLWYFMGSWQMADLLSQSQRARDVYFYRLTEPGRTNHGGDTPMWNAAKWPQDKPLSVAANTAMAFLCNFAQSGDPNGPGLPRWEAHTKEAPRYMEIGPSLGMRGRSAASTERYALVGEWIRSQCRAQTVV